MAPLLTFPPTTIRPGDRVCCAVSGGADSTALLLLVHAANALPRGALGIGLSAVHVNHSLRGAESDADQAFVEALCTRLAVPLESLRVDTAAHAASERKTIEEAARDLRYAHLRALIRSGEANVILTAHTLDDQAETVLMKLLRGAWLEGLGGIAPALEVEGGRILRPLLRLRGTELRAYLTAQHQPWREDSSNTDLAFTRNRLRAEILPLLRTENPAIDQTLANLAELAREDEARWTGELARVLPGLLLAGKPVRGGGRAHGTTPGAEVLAIELERLRTLNPALRRRVVREAARRLGARLSFDDTSRVLTLAGVPPTGLADPTVPARPGGRLRLGAGLTVERSVRELRLLAGKVAGPAAPDPPGKTPQPRS